MNVGKFFGILRKVKDLNNVEGPNPLRTKIVEGYFFQKPAEGLAFLIIGRALEKDPNQYSRRVSTSEVREIQHLDTNNIRFKTMNSIYELKIVEWLQ